MVQAGYHEDRLQDGPVDAELVNNLPERISVAELSAAVAASPALKNVLCGRLAVPDFSGMVDVIGRLFDEVASMPPQGAVASYVPR